MRLGRGEEGGGGGGGKRVNRESTCKQATRETNNVGAAGCSPPNEASRQEAGRQAGRQTDRQKPRLVFSALRARSFDAPCVCRNRHAARCGFVCFGCFSDLALESRARIIVAANRIRGDSAGSCTQRARVSGADSKTRRKSPGERNIPSSRQSAHQFGVTWCVRETGSALRSIRPVHIEREREREENESVKWKRREAPRFC